LTEPELIHALLQRQDSAFEVLVNEYKDRLFNTIIGIIQNATDAEDLVQDVFIKVFENIPRFKGESTLATWMYRIAVLHSLDFLRRKKSKKRAASVMSWFGGGSVTEEAKEFVHPGVLAENKERAAYLFKAIEQLPENQKIAFVLQKVEGLNQRDIASIMEVKEGAVESLLMRAKLNLKKSLAHYYSL
jgi:RNA polymerase sigma factor (sigma-70 family)